MLFCICITCTQRSCSQAAGVGRRTKTGRRICRRRKSERRIGII